MTPDRWTDVQDLFLEALQRPADQRKDFVADACGDDDDLRQEVLSLLDAARETGVVDKLAKDVVAPITDHWRPGSPTDRRVGPYRIVREIGWGGMGQVYLAERDDGQFDQQVAVKVMRGRIGAESTTERFLHERQILARLTHPNVARLLDGGVTDDGAPYFVMEYVDGEPIDAYCDRHRLSVDERIQLMIDVGTAVQHAHQQLIVHRDLKPSNVLVTGTPEPGADGLQVKLLDFGIAKLLDAAAGEAPQTRTGLHLMTPEYASPEQVRGGAITTATDVYAMGVLLYELLTGSRPYQIEGKTPSEIEHIICEIDPDPPSTRVREERARDEDGKESGTPSGERPTAALGSKQRARRLRGDLDTIVLKALQKDPSRRYSSAEALVDDLRRHRGGHPVRARPNTLTYRMATFVRRHRTAVAAAALVVLTLLAGIAGTAWQAVRAAEQAERAAVERDRAQQEAVKAAEVQAFLINLFEAADPNEARGDTLTAFELVAQGVARIEEELAGQPEVQADVLSAIGRVYQNLGDYERAEGLAAGALDVRRETLGPTHPDLAESLNDLGVLNHHRGQFDTAAARYREALNLRRQALAAPHEAIAATLNNLGAVYHHQGQLDSAEVYYRDALAMRRRLADADSADLSVNIANLAMVRKYKGDYETAEALLHEALAIQRSVQGDDHPSVATTLNNLGTTLFRQRKNEAAGSVLEEALSIRRAVLGPEHPLTAQSLNNFAAAQKRLGRLDRAEALYREALTIRRQVLDPAHPAIASSLNNLALVLRDRGRLDDAESLLRESLELRQQLYGDNHPRVARALNNLAELHRDRDDPSAALPLYREALRIRIEALPASHPDIARSKGALGECLTTLGRHAEAEPLLKESYGVLADQMGPGDAATQRVGRQLVTLYQATNRDEEAARYQALLAPADGS